MEKKIYIRPQAKRYEIRPLTFLEGSETIGFASGEEIKDDGDAESKGTHIWDDME